MLIFHEHYGNCGLQYIVELLVPRVGTNATVKTTVMCLSRHIAAHSLLAASNFDITVEERPMLETEQNTTFVEDNAISVLPNIQVVDSTFNDGAVDNIALGEWFSRPVPIITYLWNEGTTLDASFSPWYSYFSNATIKAKLGGYSRLRCNLHAKFLINASPFQSGLVIASYKPLTAFPGSVDYSGGNIDINKAPRNGQIVGYSQRPHVNLYPQTNEGGVLSMPFIHHQNWLNLSDSHGFDNEMFKMGQIKLTSIGNLINCSGTSGSSCNITVYLWATDVQLSGPAYELQSDEYEDRPVSAVSSVVASIAGMLSRVPVIGPYALATSMIATTASSVARLFGYSNVPTLADTMPAKIRTVGNMANTQVGEVIEPLTLDPKNELTIDSRTVGFDGSDELLISKYAGRESFFTSVSWLGSYIPGDEVFQCYVTPEMAVLDNVPFSIAGTYRVISMVPACHIGMLFRKWRGPINFRFKVLASRYHRGRLKITYDPNGDTGLDSVRQINKIWDISSSSEIEIEVPYMGSEAFKFSGQLAAYSAHLFGGYGSVLPPYSDGYFNGSLRIHVLNELTAPDVSSGVDIACYISSPKVEFAEPHNIEQQYFDDTGAITNQPVFTYLDPYDIQSDEGPVPDSTATTTSNTVTQGEAAYSVYMGEVVKSLRTLMHRTVRHSYYKFKMPDVRVAHLYLNMIMPRFPRIRGRTPAGQNSINNGIGARSYNLCRTHPLAWITAAFTGWRGSINWRVTTYHADLMPHLNVSISRMAESTRYNTNRFIEATTLDDLNTSSSKVASFFLNATEHDPEGTSMTVTSFEPVAAARAPMYTQHRMFPANPVALNDSSQIEMSGIEYDNLKFGVFAPTFADINRSVFDVELYVSAGHDFSPFYFLNVPTVYSYAADNSETPDNTFFYPITAL